MSRLRTDRLISLTAIPRTDIIIWVKEEKNVMGSIAAEKPHQVSEAGFYPFGRYLKTVFPFKVYKITIDAGFTCPNRDGERGIGGCTYCINESFSPNSRNRGLPVRTQVENGAALMRRRHGAEKFIAYFQAFSNTYGPVDVLKRVYDEALSVPGVVGLAVGTRPDCVDEEKLDLLESYSDRCRVWVEYGLQSIHDETLRRINRGHTYKEFVGAIRLTAGRPVEICVHVILGLPGETREMMLQTAEALSRLPIRSLKLHHLYIARDTVMESEFARGGLKVLGAEQYVSLVCDFLERMPPDVSVQRIVGELDGEMLIAPQWHLDKQKVIAMVTAEFNRRSTWQGCRFSA